MSGHDMTQPAVVEDDDTLLVLDEEEISTMKRMVLEAANLYDLVTEDTHTPWTDELRAFREAVKEAKAVLNIKW